MSGKYYSPCAGTAEPTLKSMLAPKITHQRMLINGKYAIVKNPQLSFRWGFSRSSGSDMK